MEVPASSISLAQPWLEGGNLRSKADQNRGQMEKFSVVVSVTLPCIQIIKSFKKNKMALYPDLSLLNQKYFITKYASVV